MASRVVQALQRGGYLHIKGYGKGLIWPTKNGEAESYEIRFIQDMGPNELKLQLFDSQDVLLVTVLFKDNTVWELRPDQSSLPPQEMKAVTELLREWDVKKYKLERVCGTGGDCFLLATYSAPYEDGKRARGFIDFTIPGGKVSDPQGCLVGVRFTTWLEPESYFASKLRQWVDEGQRLTPNQTVSGRPCIPILWREVREGFEADTAHGWPAVPPSSVTHTLFFDKESYDLVRWDANLEVFGTPLFTNPRTHVHEEMRVKDKAPGGTWELSLPADPKREVLFTYER